MNIIWKIITMYKDYFKMTEIDISPDFSPVSFDK